jgi:hypothetical protein
MGRSQDHLREREGVDSTGYTGGSTNDPVSLTVPTKSGTAQVGQTLTGVNGTFRGNGVTITRAWLRNGTPISGATGATYVLAEADLGATIKFRNTATNQFGSAVSDSTATAAVIAA